MFTLLTAQMLNGITWTDTGKTSSDHLARFKYPVKRLREKLSMFRYSISCDRPSCIFCRCTAAIRKPIKPKYTFVETVNRAG